MATSARSFTIHQRQDFASGENCVQCTVIYSKGKGYFATIQPATAKEDCVTTILDFSGKNRFPLAPSPRFSGNALIVYRQKFRDALPSLAADLAAHGPDYIRSRVEAMA